MFVLRAVAHAREYFGGQISDALDDHLRWDNIFGFDTRFRYGQFVESVGGLGNDESFWSHHLYFRFATRSLKCSETRLKTDRELYRAIHDLQAVIDRL
jgi:hypothetical protein